MIGIGAARSGTSWLYSILQQHPDIWLPPIKELHYFDRDPTYPSPSHLAVYTPLRRLFGTNVLSRNFRRIALGACANSAKGGSTSQVSWMLKYAFGLIDDHWYASLFKGRTEPIVGEITPAYAMLRSRDIAYMASLAPDAKLIFIMRDPVERTWSQAVHSRYVNSRSLCGLSSDELAAWVRSDSVAMRNDYLGTIQRFREYFPEHRFFIGFYDEIKHDPINFHRKINRFLDVSNCLLEAAKYEARVNQNSGLKMPAWVRARLHELLLPQMQQLAETFGGYAESWVNKAQETCA